MTIFIRSILIYLFLILTFRLLGKRQLGEMEPSEFVVSLLIADLAAGPMQENDMKITACLIPIVTILFLEFSLSILTFHSISFRKLFCGKPVILMQDGKILYHSLRKTRVTPDELTEHLREKGIVDLTTVKYAILETNGQISALVDPQYQPAAAKDANIAASPLSLPITIICNGRILNDNLRISGKNDVWLQRVLSERKCRASQVLLLTVDSFDNIYLSICA